MFILEVKEIFVSALNDMNAESMSNLIFSADLLSRFEHEKVHGVEWGSRDDQGLRRLILAVLEDAIACIQTDLFKPSRRHEKLSQEAEEWIYSNDDGVFSFTNVCETLGFDAEALKKGLERWKAKQIVAKVEERKRLILSKGKCLGKKKTAALGLDPLLGI